MEELTKDLAVGQATKLWNQRVGRRLADLRGGRGDLRLRNSAICRCNSRICSRSSSLFAAADGGGGLAGDSARGSGEGARNAVAKGSSMALVQSETEGKLAGKPWVRRICSSTWCW